MVPLLYLLWGHLQKAGALEVLTPIRVQRDKFLSERFPEYFEKYLRIASTKSQGGRVLVLLDSEGECVANLAQSFRTRLARQCPDLSVDFVLANRCFETWFIASKESVETHKDVRLIDADPEIAEKIAAPKALIKRSMIPDVAYSEVRHGPAFTSLLDPNNARGRSASFDRLARIIDGVWA
ncbi:DUF4276 family protein [Wenzhouxiangella sp. XN79A]|uniref:DUF4276 family protein n=1 Tax=Wenzhouxiangella sp. XN79A TaxID=2724193 RepID=UPI00144A4D1E|nr:DUF4276 family protein [Wenzhouxiangella sp. XN79A]NKI34524.1 DUF4276 family protein [Wenzhouxiangella sp. XN79A]